MIQLTCRTPNPQGQYPLSSFLHSLNQCSELENALDRVHDTSPGEDKLNYQMIKKLNNDSKIYLHDIFSKFWIDVFFFNRMAAFYNYPYP